MNIKRDSNKASLNCLSFALQVLINTLWQAFKFSVLATYSVSLPDINLDLS
jgi:hypothetical protein